MLSDPAKRQIYDVRGWEGLEKQPVPPGPRPRQSSSSSAHHERGYREHRRRTAPSTSPVAHPIRRHPIPSVTGLLANLPWDEIIVAHIASCILIPSLPYLVFLVAAHALSRSREVAQVGPWARGELSAFAAAVRSPAQSVKDSATQLFKASAQLLRVHTFVPHEKTQLVAAGVAGGVVCSGTVALLCLFVVK